MEFNVKLSPLIERAMFNIFVLLGMTAAFGSVSAYFSSYISQLPINFWVCGISYLAIMFIINTLRKKVASAFLMCFFLTIWAGFSLSHAFMPILGPNTPMYIMALGMQAAIMCFLLAFNTVMTKEVYGQMLSFSNVTLMMIPVSIVIGIILNIPNLVIISGMVLNVVSCAFILHCIEPVLNGQELNYPSTVVKTYLKVYDWVVGRICSVAKRLTKS